MPEPDNPNPGWSGRRPAPDLDQKIRPLARQLRHEMTPAESRLWAHLRRRKRLGYKFRSQHIIGQFIVDFYCAEAELVVELDGEVHHYTEEHDALRQEYLESLGLRVIRFANDDIWKRFDGVIHQIEQALKESAAHTNR